MTADAPPPPPITCQSCRETLPVQYFGIPPHLTCRRCYLHNRHPQRIRRNNMQGATHEALLADAQQRRAVATKAIGKHPCVRCKAVSQLDGYTMEGKPGKHWLLAESLTPRYFLQAYISRLTVMCNTCALGDWAARDKAGPKELDKRYHWLRLMQRSVLRKLQATPTHQRALWYRALYYWQTKLHRVRQELEEEQAMLAAQQLTPLEDPWWAIPEDEGGGKE